MSLFSFRPPCIAIIFLTSILGAALSYGQDGFADKATGGAGGATVTVKSPEEFTARATAEEPLTIIVDGYLRIGNVPVAANKTIVGANKSATLNGNLFINTTNVVLKNLQITNPMSKKGKGGGDGVTIRGGKQVWIDHCTFFDCGDGCVDATEGADWITVSWCKFYYTSQPKHCFTMLAIGRENKKKKKHKNKLHITLHHNWWAENCGSRMPAAKKAQVHMYNNYFSCSGNSYCTNARPEAEILSQNNYYQGVNDPIYAEKDGKMKTVDNIFDKCTGKAERRNDEIFEPPYAYSLEKTKKVPEIVRQGAGTR